MFRKILLGLLLFKVTTVLGTLFGKWILTIFVGTFFLYILYQKGLKLAENLPASLNKKRRWKESDSDAYASYGDWYGSCCK
jgi:uncharacterized protein (DUF58 family)